jgi:hypothetical protein
MIWPFARRTAVATEPGARIITPSITACPPTCIGLLGSYSGFVGIHSFFSWLCNDFSFIYK